MSYGYGYGGAPPGFHLQAAYPSAPPQAYTQLAPPGQQPPTVDTQGNHDAAHSSYDDLRSAIPGLGLGYAANGPARSQQTDIWTATPPASQRIPPRQDQAAQMPARSGAAADGGSEEGELSDGEVEDLYEPPEAGNDEILAGWPYGGTDVATTDQPQAHTNAARDRSGSYSPHLSPREIDRTNSSAPSALPGNSPAASSAPAPSAPKTLAFARKEAQEAILRLWPLDVQYHNYVDAGVDSALLQGLLKELGLELPTNTKAAKHSKKTVKDQPEVASVRGEEGVMAPVPTPAAVKPTDKSEERKDRIARLLAAKGSKPVVQSTKSTAVPPLDDQPATMKKLSEKSKLLQKKMEALKKQREALAQSRAQQAEITGSHLAAHDTEVPMNESAGNVTVGGDSSAFTAQAPKSADRSGELSPASIPGLFLSTPKPLPALDHVSPPDPSASNTSGMGTAEYRRPFGQNTESRPFLIHVSDDEDEDNDAEMEVDTPGGAASPDLRNEFEPHATPRRAAPVPGPARGIPDRRSASALTPARNSGNSSGGENLDSMNKKIEAMKRKIAEAEARKAKRSRQVSPSTSQHNDSSRDDSAEPSSTTGDAIIGEGITNGSRTPKSDSAMPTAPASLPTIRTARLDTSFVPAPERRSRSRAASERLPLIEARRRAQLLKLKALQAEIATIEREIEEGKAEEERLKEDLALPDSDQEREQPTAGFASLSHQYPTNFGAMPGASASPNVQSSGSTFMATAAAHELPIESSAQDAIISKGKSGIASEESGDSDGDVQALINEQSATIGGSVDGREHEMPTIQDAQLPGGDESSSGSEGDKDVQMGEHDQDVDMADASESPDDVQDNDSDDYEPPDVGAATGQDLVSSKTDKHPATAQTIPPSASGPQCEASTPLATGQTLEARAGRALESTREAKSNAERSASPKPHSSSSFVPYETPLQYFHSYRFHPSYRQSVPGGLRSLTYSNKIDVRKEVCPDQLAGQPCPRGEKCEYQHFETMKAADDQILLQLGGTGNFDDEQKQQYIAGLRELLTDFRNRKVKDFNTISQGIVEYRARFQGDKSKILPLGNVSI
ncbi:Zinc finger domain-containing protein, CCCH-type [Purpureocillium lavendulum]|uniref:Zinc finger domain-containing protein, CCCH-type n=1 Tax=Purpureocillium lavendulum TaxID=1247861 RepID=A0AB34FWY8_9HYPO|nr:Zinc finger domain-containing protein, CCCH-type [Purpureocillium lavendulum]